MHHKLEQRNHNSMQTQQSLTNTQREKRDKVKLPLPGLVPPNLRLAIASLNHGFSIPSSCRFSSPKTLAFLNLYKFHS